MFLQPSGAAVSLGYVSGLLVMYDCMMLMGGCRSGCAFCYVQQKGTTDRTAFGRLWIGPMLSGVRSIVSSNAGESWGRGENICTCMRLTPSAGD